ncbi:hypothetical protein QYH69_26685 [Paraburkholderia sp. SARCC-3016]|uniref:hypothetical protein n=1 Tax=Paraburkholderia sp. SARCC-3016 TaxID=3058611 RepID=UPI002809FB1B|nr:hypothetical protein [Paraburkholderia sp. SARCC-3016]MDQ7980827.1 hypothetical protein [Paraburkholderia sp. SARCC-3016]
MFMSWALVEFEVRNSNMLPRGKSAADNGKTVLLCGPSDHERRVQTRGFDAFASTRQRLSDAKTDIANVKQVIPLIATHIAEHVNARVLAELH